MLCRRASVRLILLVFGGLVSSAERGEASGVGPFVLEGSALKWVPALPREGHAAACARHGLETTQTDVFLPDQALPELYSGEQDAITSRPNVTYAPTPSPTTPVTLSTTPTIATRASVQPLWSEALLTLVANGLGMGLERPGGVAGCCVPGMWCGPQGCYTLAVGNSFSNHGGYVGMSLDAYSVYTCLDPQEPLPTQSSNGTSESAVAGANSDSDEQSQGIHHSNATATGHTNGNGSTDDSPSPPQQQTKIISVGSGVAQVGGALTIIGTGFGQEVEAVRVMVGGRECRDPELCHLVCRPCGEGGRCNVDEICIVDGLNNQKVCLPICDMTPGSCPCDHVCLPRPIELRQGDSTEIYLCGPPDAEPDFLCHGSQSLEEERIQCNVPVLESSEGMDDSGEVDGHRTEKKGDGGVHRKKKSGPGRGQVLTASVSLSVGGRTAVWEDGVSYELRRCSVAWDCNDGDACTVDTCVMGECVHKAVDEGLGCDVQPVHVTWRGDVYRYFQVVDRANLAEQSAFVAEVQAEHKQSSVTFTDDSPVELHNWAVDFPIFGTKYNVVYISPNGVLFVSELQTTASRGESAVSPGTEAFLPVLDADWNPADKMASSSVLLLIDEERFTVLYQDVYLFKRSALATPSTFSTTLFSDGSLRYRYMRIGDVAEWLIGVSGNTFVSPTIRNRHVHQVEFIRTDENGRPSAAAASAISPPRPPPPDSQSESQTPPYYFVTPGYYNYSSSTKDYLASSATKDPSNGDSSYYDINYNDDVKYVNDDVTYDVTDDGDDDVTHEFHDNGGVGIEATLCRAPTVGCLGNACGKAGSKVPVLWEGFGCQAGSGPAGSSSLNFTFACRFGGVEVPASLLGDDWRSSGLDDGWFNELRREKHWGPRPRVRSISNEGQGQGLGLLCEVPRLDWVEQGQDEAVLVPVEVVWSLNPQASSSARRQVARSVGKVGVRGLSVVGGASLSNINSHVLTFRYYRDDVEAPRCGCSPAHGKGELKCDSCLVCGGTGSTVDCGGFCHGEAYEDKCSKCAGGMTGVVGGVWCDDYDNSLETDATEALVTLSQSIMMLVALTIMTAFLTTCLFLARALMVRGMLVFEDDRHGRLQRRIFYRRRGLSAREISWLETVVYTGVVAEPSGAGVTGGDDNITDSVEGLNEKGKGETEEGVSGGGEELSSGVSTEVQCAICLGDFERDDVLRKLPCHHLFHQDCVDEWLELAVSCPLCKQSAREGLVRQRRSRRRRRRRRRHSRATAPSPTATASASVHSPSISPVIGDTVEAIVAEVGREDESASSSAEATTSETQTIRRRWWSLWSPSSLQLLRHASRSLGNRGNVGRGRRWIHLDSRDDGDEDSISSDGGNYCPNDGQSPRLQSTVMGDAVHNRVVADQVSEFWGEPLMLTTRQTGELGSGEGGDVVMRSTLGAFFRGGFDRDRGRVENTAFERIVEELELVPRTTAVASTTARGESNALEEFV